MTVRVRQVAALVLWGLVIGVVGSLIGGGETSGQSPNRAALVVAFNDGRTETSCVEFDEQSITGAELLRRSGLSVVFSSFGGLGSGVCQIDGTGCSDPSDCFCQCRGPDCAFWQYYAREGGSWQFQRVGASTRRVGHTDMDAWVWGDGDRPPNIGFSSVCPLEPHPAQPRPVATATPRPPAQEPRGEPSQGERPRPVNPVEAAGDGSAAPPPAGAPPATSPVDVTPRTTPSLEVTERPTAEVRRDAVSTPERDVRGAVDTQSEDGGGVPVGLIAFAAVAVALAAAAGGLFVRRRLHG